MRNRMLLAPAGLAVMILLAVSTNALAFHHHRGAGCYSGGTFYGGYGFPGCGYGGYGYGRCGWDACGSPCGGSACGSCGTCNYKGCGSGHKLHHVHCGLSCLQRKCSCCGSSCNSCRASCGGCDFGCSGGKCSSWVGGAAIIKDSLAPASAEPPADKSKVIEETAIPAEEASHHSPLDLSASSGRGRPFHLVGSASTTRQSGSAAFENGMTAYRHHSLKVAAVSFNTATEAQPGNALYHYYHALATYELAGADAASDLLDKAVQAELQEAVKDWGRRMERVQGHGRVWIEKARRDAGLIR